MWKRIIVLAVLLFAATAAYSQEWRVELGTGVQPLHMGFGDVPASTFKNELAEKGQAIDDNYGFFPNVFVSGVWQYRERWELVLTGDVSWSHHRLIQKEQFGFDHYGRPRYTRFRQEELGMKDSSPLASATLQWRRLWNPYDAVKTYSAIGFGFNTGTKYFFTPSVTLLGLRVGGDHLYGFLEAPISPYGTFAVGGLGWTF